MQVHNHEFMSTACPDRVVEKTGPVPAAGADGHRRPAHAHAPRPFAPPPTLSRTRAPQPVQLVPGERRQRQRAGHVVPQPAERAALPELGRARLAPLVLGVPRHARHTEGPRTRSSPDARPDCVQPRPHRPLRVRVCAGCRLQVGRLGCGSSHTSGCAVPSAQLLNWTRTHFAAFAIASSPLVLSIHPSDATLAPLLDIIGNKRALAVRRRSTALEPRTRRSERRSFTTTRGSWRDAVSRKQGASA